METEVDLTFFTAERMSTFWGYVRMLLESVSPIVMIVAALGALGIFITIIVKAMNKAEDDQDFEYREY